MKKVKKGLGIVFFTAIFMVGCAKDISVQTPSVTPEVTDVPTEMPIETPTPTNPPVVVSAPFTMVSPVPQSEIVDIAGTMTIDTYPIVDGSTATLPLSEAVFMAATGESAEVAAEQVVHTKTTNSYNRLYNGEVDLLIVYEPAETIVERMKTEPLCIKPIGLDALVFLANTANPLESLTMEQLVDIYSGKITNWAEVGGLDKELLAFQRPVGSGSQTLMQKLVMGDTKMVDGDNVFRYSTMSDILEGMLSYNNEDNTLGYSVFYYANNMYFEKDLKLMGVDGVIPSTQTIYDGSYQLTNAFYAVVRTDEPADSNARKIFDWLTGEAGQQLVLDLGYVPIQMPVGADISDAKQSRQEKVEILAEKPLEEEQYFVFFNPQNMVAEYYYGDMTVYNHKWEEIAGFYNVALKHQAQGVYTNRYLPIGQIRQNAEGEQVARYGIFDLELLEYSIAPVYHGMEVLDAERGYFAVPPEDDNWQNWKIINGTGDVMLPKVAMEDWLMISEFGNGYLERFYDYDNWDIGCTYRFYDENFKLKYIYCESAAMPDTEDMLEGVDYILMLDDGCLVNENGNVVLNWAVFLDKYGDGIDMDCKLQLYSVSLANEDKCYPVLYQNKVYLLDCHANLLRIIDNPVIVNSFDSAEFYERFCYYRDEMADAWTYGSYEGENLLMSDGMTPDEINVSWSNSGHLMSRVYGNRLFLEEYTADGDSIKFTVELKDSDQYPEVAYMDPGYVMISQESGEEIQNPYQLDVQMIPLCEKELYYRGKAVASTKGTNSNYLYQLDDNTVLWGVQNGNKLFFENESIYQEYGDIYVCENYVMIQDGKVMYDMENAYLVNQSNEAALFIKGNYIYAVGCDGTEYIRALHNVLNND